MTENIKYNARAKELQVQIEDQLQMITDPDLEIDVFNLGLIYEVEVDDQENCHVVITFTEVACGCQDTLPYDIGLALQKIDGITKVKVDIVYEPQWTMERITRNGRRFLGIAV
ncbi:metal-sulfur cluster assembly factor [Limosilactobacillus fermentum]|uniref:metal-sulfur cluster assembly factor n=1 Tax=Limosilactobacillus fermentum TaxID=1613 RepID=UPI00214D4F60|nr:metal-sulfur cluster assembly factor [Limosilactobacillus fermentum]UUV95570.1 metal-sulfur cluster assembly factor [Limosilactobacillus fermentum]